MTPAGDDLRLRHARRRSTPATPTRSSSASSSRPTSTARSPASASTRRPTNTGTHIGSLWTADRHAAGAGDVHQRDAPPAGRRSTFASPVAVTAGTTYVASYFAPSGHYSAPRRGLDPAVDNPPLHALANSTSSNGVYAYGATSTFPTSSFNATQLLGRRALRAAGAPGRSRGVDRHGRGAASANVTWTAPPSGGPVDDATRSRRTSARRRRRRPRSPASPPATSATVDGPDDGHDLHVHA